MDMRPAIDLTIDSSSDDELEYGGYKAGAASDSDIQIIENDNLESGDSDVEEAVHDSDVEEISPEEMRKARERADLVTEGGEQAGDGEDEVVITVVRGEITTRDLPHPRPDCAVHKFWSGKATSNCKHCKQCFCYVCDVKASECNFWGTGQCKADHANARPLPRWDRLRQAAKDGKTDRLRRHFNAGRRQAVGGAGQHDASQPQQQQTARPVTRASTAGARRLRQDADEEPEGEASQEQQEQGHQRRRQGQRQRSRPQGQREEERATGAAAGANAKRKAAV